jgi:hypothetical protein
MFLSRNIENFAELGEASTRGPYTLQKDLNAVAVRTASALSCITDITLI